MTKLQVFQNSESNFVGICYINNRHGVLTSTFSYSDQYLSGTQNYPIEPSLPLQLGNWPIATNELPNAILDSAPDRWGRNLIKKKYPEKTLNTLDFLLEASDITRQGCLRFKTDDGDLFLAADRSVPKIVMLSELLESSKLVGYGKHEDEAVKYLLDAGTASLGGARPKAIVEEGGEYWIAKFEHSSDEYDVIEEEYKALVDAQKVGITIPDIKLIKVGNSNVLLSKRFDRELKNGKYRRVGYISAMTALGAKDGDTRDYLDIIKFIQKYGSDPAEDVRQLLKRIRYSIEINNTDDHLRNHGFLWQKGGWKLSPAFDLNPNPDQNSHRVTAVCGATNRDDALLGLEKLEKELM